MDALRAFGQAGRALDTLSGAPDKTHFALPSRALSYDDLLAVEAEMERHAATKTRSDAPIIAALFGVFVGVGVTVWYESRRS